MKFRITCSGIEKADRVYARLQEMPKILYESAGTFVGFSYRRITSLVMECELVFAIPIPFVDKIFRSKLEKRVRLIDADGKVEVIK